MEIPRIGEIAEASNERKMRKKSKTRTEEVEVGSWFVDKTCLITGAEE